MEIEDLPTLADCSKYGMKPTHVGCWLRRDGDTWYEVNGPDDAKFTAFRHGGNPSDASTWHDMGNVISEHDDWKSAFEAVKNDIIERAAEKAMPFKVELVENGGVPEIQTTEEYVADCDKAEQADRAYYMAAEIGLTARIEAAIRTIEDFVYETKVRREVRETFEAFVKAYAKKEADEVSKALGRAMNV